MPRKPWWVGAPRWRAGAGLLIASALLAGSAHADQITAPSVPWFLGDWGGARTRLFQQGIDFQFGYANEFGTNTQGGVKRWAGYADQTQVGATFNLERLFGVPDAIFQVTMTERTGRNLVADAQLNALQLVQEVYGRGQTTRLTQFWYDSTISMTSSPGRSGVCPSAPTLRLFPATIRTSRSAVPTSATLPAAISSTGRSASGPRA